MRVALLLLLVNSVRFTNAQLVFMPDTNLRNFLSEVIPGAIDGDGFLDTQHPAASGLESLYMMWPPIPGPWDPPPPLDLTGIEGLTGLEDLHIACLHEDGGVLATFDDVPVTVPSWPANLKELTLRLGTYATLPPWPSALERLEYNLPSGPSSLPPLPPSLRRLDLIAGDDLAVLPDLPTGITHVTLQATVDNAVPTLPGTIDTLSITGFSSAGVAAWPTALIELSLLNIDTWTSLPAWPPDLQDLNVQSADLLTTLPPWPASLTKLSLANCAGITGLPDFNSGLLDLSLSGLWALTTVPDYPATLEELRIGDLYVAQLPDWPPLVDHIRIGPAMPNLLSVPDFLNEVRFITITGALPAIAALPAWPDSLRELILYSQSIQEIPALPSHITQLQLADMPNLLCLPFLPPSLTWFFNMVPGLCLPNMPEGLSHIEVAPEVGIPITPDLLCTVLNSTCDFLNPAVTGAVYWDQNANGTRETGEPGYPMASINAQPGNYTFGISATGEYSTGLPLDQYTLTATSNNPYVQSISPASHDVPFTGATDVDAGNDFGVVLQPNIQDLMIDLFGPWGRPGFESPGQLTYGNIGSQEMDGTITLDLDADQSWISSTPAPTTVSGNTITWEFAALQVGEQRSIQFIVYTDPSVPIGTVLQHSATVGPVGSDQTPADNVSITENEVFGSWDPNDKRVEPATLTPDQVAAGEELEYTIRFQNTGTYQADRVIITDTLSGDLQWNTMRLISTSHPCTWLMTGDGVLRFTFDPIFLPDSTSDEPNSHGFVKFAMRPVADLMLGESVVNTANIYFDFNEPIITNEAVFTVEASTQLAEQHAVPLRLWPNPVEEVLLIEGAVGAWSEVVDVTGRVVLATRMTGPIHRLNVAELPSGAYVLRALDGDHHRSATFMKR